MGQFSGTVVGNAMTAATTQSLERFDKVTLCGVSAAAAVGLLTLSRVYAPEVLGTKMRLASAFLTWGSFLTVALIWVLDLPFRARALAWLLAWSAEIGAALMLIFGASGLFHFSVQREFPYLSVFGPFLFAAILLFFASGFLRRRAWVLTVTVRVCQITVALTLLSGLFSGISAAEFRGAVECALIWYWLSRPQVQELFA
jgi:hypothetical protein